MNRKNFVRCLSLALLGSALTVALLFHAAARAEDAPAGITTIKGTCEFMRQQGTWSATLKPTDTPGVYDADYVASFRMGGDHMTYVGKIKSDFKTSISGSGNSTGGGGNGNFEFSGNYGDDGIAQCNYKEVGGMGRSGSLTAGKPE